MLIVIRGGGDLATGVALRLYRSGMDVVICTTAKTDEEAKALLELVGAPFER